MIRTSTRKVIQTILEESYFGDANFQVEYGVDSRSLLKIAFIPNPQYSLTLDDVSERFQTAHGNRFLLTCSPGRSVVSESEEIAADMDSCIAAISEWVLRLKEDVIDSNPINREIQFLRAELEGKLAEISGSLDDYFSKQEAQALAEKLTEFGARIDALSATSEELHSTVAKLSSTVESLLAAINQVNKGTWLRMAAGKLLSTARSVLTSKEARELALEAAKKLLLEGPK